MIFDAFKGTNHFFLRHCSPRKIRLSPRRYAQNEPYRVDFEMEYLLASFLIEAPTPCKAATAKEILFLRRRRAVSGRKLTRQMPMDLLLAASFNEMRDGRFMLRSNEKRFLSSRDAVSAIRSPSRFAVAASNWR